MFQSEHSFCLSVTLVSADTHCEHQLRSPFVLIVLHPRWSAAVMEKARRLKYTLDSEEEKLNKPWTDELHKRSDIRIVTLVLVWFWINKRIKAFLVFRRIMAEADFNKALMSWLQLCVYLLCVCLLLFAPHHYTSLHDETLWSNVKLDSNHQTIDRCQILASCLVVADPTALERVMLCLHLCDSQRQNI